MMKNGLRIVTILMMAVLLFLPLQSAGAAGGKLAGQVYFGQAFTLKSGQTMDGDLLLLGGSATIEKGATVNGSTVIFGGTLTMNGTVNGDVAVTGGSVTLGPASHISGSLTTVSATLDRAVGSVVDGQIYNTSTSMVGTGENGQVPQLPGVTPPAPIVPNFRFNFNPFWSVMNGIGQALGIAVLAMLLMLFLAPHADRVAHAVIAQPLTAGGLGLLTIIVAPIAMVLSVITLILIPLAPIIAIALVVAAVFGWIAIGYEVGQRFTKAIHQNWHPAFSAGLGTFALTLVAKLLTDIPVLNCVGWLVPFLLSMAALGAVLMTRFGTQTVSSLREPAVIVPVTPAE